MARVWMGSIAVVALAAGCNLGQKREASHDQPVVTTEVQPPQTLALPSDKDAERLSSALALVDALERGQRDVGDMAADRAVSKDVKDLAAKLRTASDEDVTSLQKLAEDGHMTFADARADPIYKATDASARAARSRLEGLKGAQFDAAFWTSSRACRRSSARWRARRSTSRRTRP